MTMEDLLAEEGAAESEAEPQVPLMPTSFCCLFLQLRKAARQGYGHHRLRNALSGVPRSYGHDFRNLF